MDGSGVPDTRESIRLATLELLERNGTGNITTRAIAAAAGVNLAAINYHFRTKEALLEGALDTSWKSALEDLRSFLAGEPWDAREKLRDLAAYLIEGGTRFPNLTRAQLLGVGKGRTQGYTMAPSLRVFLGETSARVSRALGIPDDDGLMFRTGAFFSSLFFPVLFPTAFPPLDRPVTRARYAGILVDDFLDSARR